MSLTTETLDLSGYAVANPTYATALIFRGHGPLLQELWSSLSLQFFFIKNGAFHCRHAFFQVFQF